MSKEDKNGIVMFSGVGKTGLINKLICEPVTKALDELRQDYIEVFGIEELNAVDVYKTYNKYFYAINEILEDINLFGFIHLVDTDKDILEASLEPLRKLLESRRKQAIEIMDERRNKE